MTDTSGTGGLVDELKGEVAVVTGGSRGIGEAIGHALAAGGATVALLARDGARAAEAAAGLPGTGHRGYACDVSDMSAAQEVVTAVESDIGPIGILVNNAGITRDNILLRMKDEEWDEVMSVNLKGAFNMTRVVTRGMMKRRKGVILNMTSVIGVMGNAGQANYSASKAGLIGFTKSVAKELASRNIRCNAIAPGFIETDMTASLGAETIGALQERIALGRLGVPGDIAAAARFLAGPWAAYITGQLLTVDGGMVM